MPGLGSKIWRAGYCNSIVDMPGVKIERGVCIENRCGRWYINRKYLRHAVLIDKAKCGLRIETNAVWGIAERLEQNASPRGEVELEEDLLGATAGDDVNLE